MAVRGTSPSLSQTGQPRMLRVEFRGQPYDWFSLDEMGDVVRSEDFSNTLRENIAHYFSVPYDCQAIFDEDGLLTAPIDFVRSLQRPQPYLRVFDVRELPDDLREQGMKLLAVLGESVERAHKMLTIYPGDRMPAEPVAAPSPAPPQPPPQSAAAGSGEPPLPSTPPPPASATAPGGAGDGGAPGYGAGGGSRGSGCGGGSAYSLGPNAGRGSSFGNPGGATSSAGGARAADTNPNGRGDVVAEFIGSRSGAPTSPGSGQGGGGGYGRAGGSSASAPAAGPAAAGTRGGGCAGYGGATGGPTGGATAGATGGGDVVDKFIHRPVGMAYSYGGGGSSASAQQQLPKGSGAYTPGSYSNGGSRPTSPYRGNAATTTTTTTATTSRSGPAQFGRPSDQASSAAGAGGAGANGGNGNGSSSNLYGGGNYGGGGNNNNNNNNNSSSSSGRAPYSPGLGGGGGLIGTPRGPNGPPSAGPGPSWSSPAGNSGSYGSRGPQTNPPPGGSSSYGQGYQGGSYGNNGNSNAGSNYFGPNNNNSNPTPAPAGAAYGRGFSTPPPPSTTQPAGPGKGPQQQQQQPQPQRAPGSFSDISSAGPVSGTGGKATPASTQQPNPNTYPNAYGSRGGPNSNNNAMVSFDLVDTNHDGVISRDEWKSMEATYGAINLGAKEGQGSGYGKMSPATQSPYGGPPSSTRDNGSGPAYQAASAQPDPRAGQFEVRLDKRTSGGGRFGFAHVPSQDGRSLLITWVDPTGLLGGWNRSNPGQVVSEGDMIVSVNGFTGDIEAMQGQLQSEAISIIFQRNNPGPTASRLTRA